MHLFAISFVSLLSAVTASAAEGEAKVFDLVSLPGSTVKLDGDSTVRKYTANAPSVTVSGSARAASGSQASGVGALPWMPVELVMTLPVANLSSGERTLDKHMRENLKSEQNHSIEMKLNHFEFPSSSLKATGTLTVAGVTKPLELEPATKVDGQKVNFKGKKKMLMSDFGITPPVLMMGSLKTRDAIEISYDITLTPKKDGKTE